MAEEKPTSPRTKALGIDIGGSGIKAAPVNTKTGELLEKRKRMDTPSDGNPAEMMDIVRSLIKEFKWRGKVGCGFPGVIQDGTICTAANLDKTWIGTNLRELAGELGVSRITPINDADAAALCEMRFGAGRDHQGVVILVTVGTGLGTSMFIDGQLVPNTEFGHLLMKHPKKGKWDSAELMAADSARKREDLSWSDWAKRFDDYLHYLCRVCNPACIIVGGGVAKKSHKFKKHLTIPVPIEMATYKNQAGIVGAALAAAG